MEKKKTVEKIKLESRYFDEHNIEWVRRLEYRGEDLVEQLHFRLSGGSWSEGSVFRNTDYRWALRIDRKNNWEVQRFTPIKGIRSKIK
jgi:hypothetical protein